jgi:hypothetical protein
MIWNADLLHRLGFTGNLYYLVQLPIAIAAGKKLGRMLELSGSAGAFLLVVILVLAIKTPWRANEVKIEGFSPQLGRKLRNDRDPEAVFRNPLAANRYLFIGIREWSWVLNRYRWR